MSVMVVGGAGYIGAHVVKLLCEDGYDVVVVDDLSTSTPERISSASLEVFDISESEAVSKLVATIQKYDVDSVIHFAAKKQVGESVERPLYYYRQNLCGLVNLLEAMEKTGVKKMVFSSSAAVYGAPDTPTVDEDSSTNPVNPYGRTKLIGEWMMGDCQRAWGLNWIALRYFNVAGAGSPDLGDPAIMNLVPMVFDRLAKGEAPRIFGDDYDTSDGTCIRDYVHVQDLAQAHIDSLRALDGEVAHRIFNVGTGKGTSVKEVVDTVREVTGIDFTAIVEGRRAGDPPKLIGDCSRIRTDLGFETNADVKEIVQSAWDAWQAGPRRVSGGTD